MMVRGPIRRRRLARLAFAMEMQTSLRAVRNVSVTYARRKMIYRASWGPGLLMQFLFAERQVFVGPVRELAILKQTYESLWGLKGGGLRFGDAYMLLEDEREAREISLVERRQMAMEPTMMNRYGSTEEPGEKIGNL